MLKVRRNKINDSWRRKSTNDTMEGERKRGEVVVRGVLYKYKGRGNNACSGGGEDEAQAVSTFVWIKRGEGKQMNEW